MNAREARQAEKDGRLQRITGAAHGSGGGSPAHTAGPWVVWEHPNPGFGCEVRMAEPPTVASVVIAEHVEPHDAVAIAALPELLEAAKEMVLFYDEMIAAPEYPAEDVKWVQPLRDAIAKAEGSAD